MQNLLVERDSFFYILEKARGILDSMIDIIDENKIFLNGSSHMAEQPEFKDIGKLANLFKLFDEKTLLLSILKKDMNGDDIRISIGSELDSSLSDCGMITKNYHIGPFCRGVLGIIGPIRMEYARYVSIVDYISSILSDTLSER